MTIEKTVRETLFSYLPSVKGVMVALSGGADSVALLFALTKIAKEEKLALCATHVHHQLRGSEADRDAEFCRQLCCDLGVPFSCRYVDVPAFVKESGLSQEDAARQLRYACLAKAQIDFGADVTLTAHHQNDQVETVLMRILRGTSLEGLGAMETAQAHCLRPLLSVTRSEILDYCQKNRLQYVTDSTNEDPSHLRNFVRHQVLPLLKEKNPRTEEALCRLSQNAREENDYWKEAVDALIASNPDCASLQSCHNALLKRYFSRVAYQKGAKNVTFAQLDALCHLVKEGKTGQSVSLFPALRVRRSYQKLIWEEEKRTAAWDPILLPFGKTNLPNGDCVFFFENKKELEEAKNIYKSLTSAAISFAKIEGQLCVRQRKDGDTVAYGGMTHTYKRFAQSFHLDEQARNTMPLICDESGIVWIPDLAISDRVRCKEEKKEMQIAYLAYLRAESVS